MLAVESHGVLFGEVLPAIDTQGDCGIRIVEERFEVLHENATRDFILRVYNLDYVV